MRIRLSDPRVRLGLGAAGVAVTAMSVRRDRVGGREARFFHAVNGLPDEIYPPVWTVMQLGTLAAAPAAAAVAYAAGDRRLAGRLVVAGTATWALSKAVKAVVKRPRPNELLQDAHCRGREQTGLGYLSGHAGVVMALALAAAPRLRGRARVLAAAAVPVVGLARIYVGAHLPLDVLGGASLGVAIDAAVALSDGD